MKYTHSFAVRIKILSRKIVKKRKDRPGLAEENLPQRWEGGGGEHLHEQHHQGGGGGEDGAVQFLKSKLAIKQHENVDIFVTNIKKYKEKTNVKQLVNEFEVEEWRTRSRVTRAVVEEQSGLSSPYKRLKMPELRPPPNAHSMPGPHTMRSSSSCPSTPPRSRSSSSARPRKRGPLPSSSSIAYAIPPPTVKTPLKLGMPVEGTKSRPLSRRTASSLSVHTAYGAEASRENHFGPDTDHYQAKLYYDHRAWALGGIKKNISLYHN